MGGTGDIQEDPALLEVFPEGDREGEGDGGVGPL